MNHRYVVVSALVVVGSAALSIACTSKSGSAGGSGAGCGALFDAFTTYDTECAPGRTILGDRARFLESCALVENAPGASSYESALESCASTVSNLAATCGTLGALDCAQPFGTLANGAACGDGSQCMTGYCKVMATGSGVLANGGACGLCATTIPVGQACTNLDTCAIGSQCVIPPTNMSGMGTCTARTVNDIGGACDEISTTCKAGATCDSDMKKCVALGDVGATCAYYTQCKYPLPCVAGKCTTGKNAGDACTFDPNGFSDCEATLACDKTTMKCATPKQVDPGAVCDDASLVCKKGSCNIDFSSGSSNTTGTCPTVIADGMPCDGTNKGQTCDDSAQCTNGKCAIFDPSTCK